MKNLAFQNAAMFCALLTLLVLGLGLNVSLRRIRNKTFLGDGGDKALFRAVRMHGNAAEHIPVLMVMLLVLAWLKAPADHVMYLGLACVLARSMHAFGMAAKIFLISASGSAINYTLQGVMAGYVLYLVKG